MLREDRLSTELGPRPPPSTASCLEMIELFGFDVLLVEVVMTVMLALRWYWRHVAIHLACCFLVLDLVIVVVVRFVVVVFVGSIVQYVRIFGSGYIGVCRLCCV